MIFKSYNQTFFVNNNSQLTKYITQAAGYEDFPIVYIRNKIKQKEKKMCDEKDNFFLNNFNYFNYPCELH